MTATGTYVLLVELSASTEIEIGRLGRRHFRRGNYAYVGSAFGPGGLDTRLGRYARGPRKKHWHIDSLLEHAELKGALVNTGPSRLECSWAEWLKQRSAGWVRGFGSSDCRCSSHLFFFEDEGTREEIIRAAGCHLKAKRWEAGRGL